MKVFYIVFLVLVTLNTNAQRYFVVNIDSSSSDSCKVKLTLSRYNLKQTSQFVFGHSEPFRLISNSSEVTNVCKGSKLIISTMDSACVSLDNSLYINPNSSKQITLDTVIITMPSSPTACDGSLYFKFKNVGPTESRSFGSSWSGSGTTDSIFTGLCEDKYYYGITHSGSTTYDYYIQIDLTSNTPTPCSPFDVTVDMTPSSSPGCNGSLLVTPNDGDIFSYIYYIFNYCCMVNPSTAVGYANSLCSGIYTVYIEHPANSYRLLSKGFYVDTTVADSSWGVPPIILPTTDTILVPSVFNCLLDYSMPLDTVYLDNFQYAGLGNYEFYVYIVQGTDTIVLNETAIIDTSHNFFIDVTVYCDDASIGSRSSTQPEGALRNFVYHGEQTLTPVQNYTNYNASKIDIFPNPTIGTLSLKLNSIKLKTIEILDMNGVVLKSFACNSSTLDIDVSSLTAAPYLIRYTDEENNKGFQRFVKLH